MAGSGGNRKHKRSRIKCGIYRSKNIKMVNKIKKLNRHVKKYPRELQGLLRLKYIKTPIR